MKLFFMIAFVLAMTLGSAYAQSDGRGKKKTKSKQEQRGFNPSSRDFENSQVPHSAKPATSQKSSTFKKKSKAPKGGDRLVEEYHQRMEANVKRNKKMAKEMQKPQYSDPSYFGHKKKPKKRPLGKRKFCKECGIVH